MRTKADTLISGIKNEDLSINSHTSGELTIDKEVRNTQWKKRQPLQQMMLFKLDGGV